MTGARPPAVALFVQACLDLEEADARQLAKDLDRWKLETVARHAACGCQGCILASLIDSGHVTHPDRLLADIEVKRGIVAAWVSAYERQTLEEWGLRTAVLALAKGGAAQFTYPEELLADLSVEAEPGVAVLPDRLVEVAGRDVAEAAVGGPVSKVSETRPDGRTSGLGPAFLDPDLLERSWGSFQIEARIDDVWVPVTPLVPVRAALVTLAPALTGPTLTRLVQHAPGKEPRVEGHRRMLIGETVELRFNLEPPISA